MVADGNWTYGDHFVINREILNHYVVYQGITSYCRSIIIQNKLKIKEIRYGYKRWGFGRRTSLMKMVKRYKISAIR